MSLAPALDIPVSLADLAPFAWAVISEVHAAPEDQARLMGLGICVGRRVRVVKAGDPLILQVYGTRIGLSGRLARAVRVIEEGVPSLAA